MSTYQALRHRLRTIPTAPAALRLRRLDELLDDVLTALAHDLDPDHLARTVDSALALSFGQAMTAEGAAEDFTKAVRSILSEDYQKMIARAKGPAPAKPSTAEAPERPAEQQGCDACGTTWTASEPLPCPTCQDARAMPQRYLVVDEDHKGIGAVGWHGPVGNDDRLWFDGDGPDRGKRFPLRPDQVEHVPDLPPGCRLVYSPEPNEGVCGPWVVLGRSDREVTSGLRPGVAAAQAWDRFERFVSRPGWIGMEQAIRSAASRALARWCSASRPRRAERRADDMADQRCQPGDSSHSNPTDPPCGACEAARRHNASTEPGPMAFAAQCVQHGPDAAPVLPPGCRLEHEDSDGKGTMVYQAYDRHGDEYCWGADAGTVARELWHRFGAFMSREDYEALVREAGRAVRGIDWVRMPTAEIGRCRSLLAAGGSEHLHEAAARAAATIQGARDALRRAGIDGLPDDLAGRIDALAAERLAKARDWDVASAERDKARADRNYDTKAAHAALNDAGAPGGAPPPERIKALRSILVAVRRDLKGERGALAAAHAEIDGAREVLRRAGVTNGDTLAERIDQLVRDHGRKLEAEHDATHQAGLRAERAEAEIADVRQALGADANESTAHAAQRTCECLEDWQAMYKTQEGKAERLRMALAEYRGSYAATTTIDGKRYRLLLVHEPVAGAAPRFHQEDIDP